MISIWQHRMKKGRSNLVKLCAFVVRLRSFISALETFAKWVILLAALICVMQNAFLVSVHYITFSLIGHILMVGSASRFKECGLRDGKLWQL